MHWQYTPYFILLFSVTVIALILIVYVWSHRSTRGAIALMIMIQSATVWSLGYAFELAADDLATKLFWAKFQYLGIVTIPVALLAFALQYTNQDKWLTPRRVALLTVIPLITVVSVWTNESHHLIWEETKLGSSDPFPLLVLTYGPWFWVNLGYAYVLLFLTTIQLISMFRSSPQLYRRQTGVILLGLSLPWIANGIYLLRLGPIPQLDLTPFAYILSGIAFALGLFRFKLLDIVPVARRAIVEGMSDGVIVFDPQGRIVDINAAAQRIIGRTAAETIGQPAAEIFADQAELFEQYRDVAEAHSEITLWSDPTGSKFATESHSPEDVIRNFELHISSLTDRSGRFVARVVVLHDITARKQAETRLLASYEEAERLVQERTWELAQTNEALEAEIAERKQVEEALRESETKYRQLVKYAPAGIYEIDFVRQKFINVNDVMCDYTGYTREEFLALSPFEILTEDSLRLFIERQQRALRGEQIPESVEYQIKGRNNHEFWVILNSRWHYENGIPIGATVVVHDITERKLAEHQIRASLKEKEVLLQEIHHRVKNNLQIISSLLSLQSGYIKEQQARANLQDSQDRVRSMALIHEKLYRSANLAQIDFVEYIQDLIGYLSQVYNAAARGIVLDIRADDISLAIDVAVPCGLILNELVSNALKHAFPDGRTGHIQIELQIYGNHQATLTIADNGVGFPTNLDFHNTSSLGLQLVNTLVNQLHGIIEMSCNGKTEFRISLTLPQKEDLPL